MRQALASTDLLSRKAATLLLIFCFAFVLPGAAFAQEPIPPDPGMDVPPAAEDTEPATDPEIEPDHAVEPAAEDEEPPPEEESIEAKPLAMEAGGAQSGALSFKIPAQSQATVDQSTGALLYEYPIELPPGRAGMTPELSLRYNSRNATKLDSIAGLGWELSIPYIQREPIRGTNNLYTTAYFSSSLSGNLIATTITSSTPYTTYRPESDDGSYLRYVFNSDQSWTVTGKDGRTYTFGGSSASRQDDPGDSSKVYKWMLSKIADAHGNEIQYSYIKDSGQIYPSQILYTYHPSAGAANTVTFTYSTPANYGATGYNGGFAVTTYKLLSTIVVTTTIGAATATRTYTPQYTNAQFLKQKMLIVIAFTFTAPSLEYTSQAWNDIAFSYATKTPGWEQGTHTLQNQMPDSEIVMYGIYTADFDRNGYPDVLISRQMNNGSTHQRFLLNSGTNFVESTSSWSVPTSYGSSGVGEYTAIVDLNGDGLPDLHSRQGAPEAVYLNTGSGFSLSTSSPWYIPDYVPESWICAPNVGDTISFGSNTYLYDINGDGKNDILYFGGTSDFRVFLNNGNGWTQSSAYTFTGGGSFTIPATCGLRGDIYDKFQYLLDVNGDGQADYVNQVRGTYINTGTGFAYSAAYSLDIPDMRRSGIADINGDGLIDYISTVDYPCARVFLNNGSGFSLANPTIFPPCTNSNVWYPVSLNYVSINSANWGTLLDLTGDGFPDALRQRNGNYEGKLKAINDGRKDWIDNSNVGDNWWPLPDAGHGVFFDINADGVPDFITNKLTFSNTQYPSKTHLGKPAAPNRLAKITSPLGAETVIEYSTGPTNLDDTDIAPMPVVGKITIQNLGQSQPSMVMKYAFSGGAYVADPATGQRRFAGFHKVTATESGSDLSALRVKETYFHQANGSDSATNEPADTSLALIGKPYRSVVKHPSGIPKTETWTKYGSQTLVTEPDTGRLSKFVCPTETVIRTTESGATTATAETYAYDTALGELAAVQNLGFVSAASNGTYTDISGDTGYQFFEYATSSVSGIVRPKRADIRTSPSSGDTISRTDYFYDNQTYGAIGSYGDLTKETKWISGNGATSAATSYTYDVFGNKLTVTNPLNATTTYAYDISKSQIVTETNALNHVTSYGYTAGMLRTVTDPNGRLTTYGYSNMSWLYRTTVQNNAGDRSKYQWLEFASGIWRVKTKLQITPGGYDYTWQSIDTLGRPVRNLRLKTNHTTGIATEYYLRSALTYDALGREVTRSEPYGTPVALSAFDSLLTVAVPSSLVTTTAYDAFDRPTSVTNALGTTTLAYAGPETLTTDANGKTKRTKTDAYGNLVEVKEYKGTSTYTTGYAYDARNLLTGVTDALGNVRSFTYNNAGWLTNSEDLHAPGDNTFGSTSFTYDANGNQLVETQPNGTVVTRVFDLLDRPTSIDGSTTAATDFNLTYDSCTKGIGRLCGVSGTFLMYGLTLSKSFVYGASMPASITLTTLEKTFTTSYQYSLSDEISRITHPDGTVVRYAFGDWGLPWVVYTTLPGGSETTYATAGYHHTLQPETIAISTGPTLSYVYDSNKLYRRASFSALMGGATLQSYAYSYDNLNNVTQIIEPGLTKAYTYDDLSRLTQAVHAPSAGPSTTYTYAYDAIGNITSVNGTAYAYSGAGKTNPHAVTSIGSDLYAYDDNGNVVVAPNQTLGYTWQNQVASVITGGTASTVLAYDETGERFLYQTYNSAEVQVSEEYLVRGDRYLVGASAPEITVKLGMTPIGLVSGGVVYATITDHLGTPVKQVNASGTVVESASYGPFGAVLATSGTINSKRGYTGHEEDQDTGLVYAEARYYSPAAQRFFQQDPSHVYLGHQNFQGLIGADRRQILSDPQQLNSYSYVRNNPVTLTDPTGKIPPLAFALGAVILAYAPQITTFLQDLTTPLGQYAVSEAFRDAQSGNYGWAAFGLLTAGEGSSAGRYSDEVVTKVKTILGPEYEKLAEQGGERAALLLKSSNEKVKNLVKSLYKAADKIPGGTAGAAIYTKISGQPVGGTNHAIKISESLGRIGNIFNSVGRSLSSGDIAVLNYAKSQLTKAESMLKSLLKSSQ